MQLARYTMYAAGILIYAAPTWDSGEACLSTLRHIAVECRCYVIGCCSALSKESIPERYEFRDRLGEWINAGDSAIVNPRGKIIAGPVAKEETILYAECDLREVQKTKKEMATAGHYARPDVFKIRVDRSPQNVID